MDWDVMISYLPRFWQALGLTLRVGWQGVAIAFALGLAGRRRCTSGCWGGW